MLWYTVLATHITIICITIYLHRSQTHNGVSLHVALSHFMRFWLWLTTGTVTKEWVATHRKHHRYSDQAGDPHSPSPYFHCSVSFASASPTLGDFFPFRVAGLWKLFCISFSLMYFSLLSLPLSISLVHS